MSEQIVIPTTSSIINILIELLLPVDGRKSDNGYAGLLLSRRLRVAIAHTHASQGGPRVHQACRCTPREQIVVGERLEAERDYGRIIVQTVELIDRRTFHGWFGRRLWGRI